MHHTFVHRKEPIILLNASASYYRNSSNRLEALTSKRGGVLTRVIQTRERTTKHTGVGIGGDKHRISLMVVESSGSVVSCVFSQKLAY